LKNGSIDQDGVPLLSNILIRDTSGDLSFVGGQELDQQGNLFPQYNFSKLDLMLFS
jgi:hypothetical protein